MRGLALLLMAVGSAVVAATAVAAASPRIRALDASAREAAEQRAESQQPVAAIIEPR